MFTLKLWYYICAVINTKKNDKRMPSFYKGYSLKERLVFSLSRKIFYIYIKQQHKLSQLGIHCSRGSIQKQPFADVFQKRCFLKCCNTQRKTHVLESLFNKVAGLKACNFIEKRTEHRCFYVTIAKFPSFVEHFW